MTASRATRRRGWKVKLGAGIVTALCCIAPASGAPPVLTVCEVLENIDLYRGKDVVIIGRLEWTFEGGFLHEKCNADDRVLIQGSRWVSMIALGAAERSAETDGPLPVDEGVIREKLRPVDGYRSEQHAEGEDRSPVARSGIKLAFAEWVAVYGTLESPARLKPHVPPSASRPRNTPGNGYGANGSVPVSVRVIRMKAFPPKG